MAHIAICQNKLQTLFYPIIMQSIFLFLLHTVPIGIFGLIFIIVVVIVLDNEGTTNNFL